MASLKKYNLEGKQTGELDFDDQFLEVSANSQMIKEYIVALRHNERQWSASTKGRSEVKHTTKKPHPQKKLGRARQGSLVAPQFRGGGIVFGPQPKFNQHVRINKKERRKVIRHLIAQKIKEGKLLVLEESNLEKPQTKLFSNFLKSLDLKGKVLFLSESQVDEIESNGEVKQNTVSSDKHLHIARSLNNLPKTAFNFILNVNAYDITWSSYLCVYEKALPQLSQWLQENRTSK